MSRYIGHNTPSGCELVWKYPLGSPSEMHRIFTELGIGKYEELSRIEDRLTLIRTDLFELENAIQKLQKSETPKDNQWFVPMLEAFCDCIRCNPDTEEFIFEADLE